MQLRCKFCYYKTTEEMKDCKDLNTSRHARTVAKISESIKLYRCAVMDTVHANLNTRSSAIAK